MSDLFAFGLGWACGAIGIAIVIGSAWLRFGRLHAIAAAYDSAILRALRASRNRLRLIPFKSGDVVLPAPAGIPASSRQGRMGQEA